MLQARTCVVQKNCDHGAVALTVATSNKIPTPAGSMELRGAAGNQCSRLFDRRECSEAELFRLMLILSHLQRLCTHVRCPKILRLLPKSVAEARPGQKCQATFGLKTGGRLERRFISA